MVVTGEEKGRLRPIDAEEPWDGLWSLVQFTTNTRGNNL